MAENKKYETDGLLINQVKRRKRKPLKTFQELYKSTDMAIKKRAKKVVLFRIRTRLNWYRVSFLVRSLEKNSDPGGYIVSVLFPNLHLRHITENRNKLNVLNKRVQIFCTCPAFLYSGAHYHATNESYLISGVEKERRPPKIRDPKNKNKLCKHIAKVYQALNTMSTNTLINLFSKNKDLQEVKSLKKYIIQDVERLSEKSSSVVEPKLRSLPADDFEDVGLSEEVLDFASEQDIYNVIINELKKRGFSKEQIQRMVADTSLEADEKLELFGLMLPDVNIDDIFEVGEDEE